MVIVDYMYEPKTVVNGCVYLYFFKKIISSDNNLTNNRSDLNTLDCPRIDQKPSL